MRVLIATQNLEVVGGIETYLRTLIPKLLSKGFDVAVLVYYDCEDKSKSLTATCPEISVWSCFGRTIDQVMGVIEIWDPDIVYYQGLDDPVLETAIISHFPSVFYAHNYHGTCVSGTKTNGVAGKPCHRTLGPGCLLAYYPLRCGGLNPITMVSLFQKSTKRNYNFSLYKFILVASHYMVEEFCRHGVEKDRIGLAPLFPTGTVPDQRPPEKRPFSNRVLWVGRITWLKGLSHLIDALRVVSPRLGRVLTLVVAGDGPDRPMIESMARKAAVPVEFLGWVSAERRNAEMRKADILAVPSIWPEPFGLVGLEAGCVGLPAVAYGTGGIPDWLIPGVSGELAPGVHPVSGEFGDALYRALEDLDHLQKLRMGAWEMSKKFTPEVHLEGICEIFYRVSKRASLMPG